MQFEVDQPSLTAFLTTYSDGRWVLMLSDDVDRDPDQQRAAVRQAVGIPDLPVELLATGAATGPMGRSTRWSSDELGTTTGAAAITAEITTATATVEFSAHAFLNPAITVGSDRASGAWLLWIASVGEHGPAAVYLSADLGYLRTAQGWRIDAIRIGDGIRIPSG